MSAENDMFSVVGDAEFEQLARSGAYTGPNDNDVLRRSEGDQHFL